MREAIVDKDVIDIDVRSDVERYSLVHRTIVAIGRLNVEHPIDAAHLLLDWGRHRLFDGERVRPRIRRREVNLRRQNLWKLRNRQPD